MKLFELDLHNTPIEDENLPNSLNFGEVYEYDPKLVNDVTGHIQEILTIYSFRPEHTGKKSYAILSDKPILMKILKTSHLKKQDHVERVLRVRIVSDVTVEVARFSVVNKHFTKNLNDEKIIFKLKDLPDFENLDKYSDIEFREKFGRVRLRDDHGLVGWVYIDKELQHGDHESKIGKKSVTKSSSAPHSKAKHKEPEHLSKMDRAMAIYKANHHQGRLRVIQLFQTLIHLTPKGASSYYTRCKHAFEDK